MKPQRLIQGFSGVFEAPEFPKGGGAPLESGLVIGRDGERPLECRQFVFMFLLVSFEEPKLVQEEGAFRVKPQRLIQGLSGFFEAPEFPKSRGAPVKRVLIVGREGERPLESR